ncbi:hypothetical protein ACFOMD_07010 [Sphingoaurantiacus capsulatus]|uniref:EF-hand domain-containing protein n=1 Tax=Sphingoaurantiacus capsulatus TaxID=1771310 RepID=A0ABV7XAP0_9SPHN
MRTKILLAVSTAILASAVTFAAPGQGGGHRGFAKFDANSDGSVTRAEVDAKAATRFAMIDSNKDGFVTPAELKAQQDNAKAKWAEKRAERAEKAGEKAKARVEKRGDRMEKRFANREGKAAERFAARDANKDGRLSLTEFQAGGGKYFERFDADKNGTVTREEVAAAREAWKAKRKG